jgi:hypothetical protein
MATYYAGDARLRSRTAVVLDDTVINLWAKTKDDLVDIVVDGAPVQGSRRRPSPRRDVRNSTFALGRLVLGDRHIVEVTGHEAEFVAVDMKTASNRRWYGAESPFWGTAASINPESRICGKAEGIEPFASSWGGPCGAFQRQLRPGESVEIDVPASDISIAYVDDPHGGELVATVDGIDRLRVATNLPFTTVGGEKLFMENRRGVRGLPFGLHRVRVAADRGPVRLLGLFAYDTRPNRSHERVLRGYAVPGDRIDFTSAFRARPLVIVGGGLNVGSADIHGDRVTFGGTNPGSYEIFGE